MIRVCLRPVDEGVRGSDAGYHTTQVQGELQEANQKHAGAKATRDAKQNQLGELQPILEALRGKKTELGRVRAQHKRLVELQKLLEFVRKTIRDAGPRVNALLVRQISQGAQVLFRELIGDNQIGLRWSKDYVILLSRGGHERSLIPAAGSERVAAAIAVRVALLQNMGEVRFVFFDEPTVHLDEIRRGRLVDQILGLPYFHQLFVISHDDSFERATDHVVHVTRDNERSVVTCG